MTKQREYLEVAVGETITLAGPVEVEFLHRVEGYRMGVASAPEGGELFLTGIEVAVYAKLVDVEPEPVKLSTGARYLKRGDTFDPEDARMTHRLRVAAGILREAGYVPTTTHGATPGNETVEFGRPRHGCDYHCTTEWPAAVTDEMLQEAFDKACAIQDERARARDIALSERYLARFASRR